MSDLKFGSFRATIWKEVMSEKGVTEKMFYHGYELAI
jgi:hypothetical protein